MRRKQLKVIPSSRRPKLVKIDHVAKFICDGTGFRRLRFHPVNAYNHFQYLAAYGYKKDGKTLQDDDDDYCDETLYALENFRLNKTTPLQRNKSRRPGRSLGGLRYRRMG
jgi:hypothetical protein